MRPIALKISSPKLYSLVGLDRCEHVTQWPEFFRPTDPQFGQVSPAKAAHDPGWTAQYTMRDVISMMLDAGHTAVSQWQADM